MSSSLSDVGKDSREAVGRLTHGVAQATDASTNILVSLVTNTIGIGLAVVGEIITWVVRRPFMAVLVGILGGAGTVGVKNSDIADNQVNINWEGINQDISTGFGEIKTSVLNYDYSSIPMPNISFPGFGSAETDSGQQQPVSGRQQYRQQSAPTARQVKYREPTRQSNQRTRGSYQNSSAWSSPKTKNSDEYLTSRGATSSFQVENNAYHTARINSLSFRPGSDVQYTLRNCRFIHKGTRLNYSYDADGFVAGCRPVK